MKVDTCPDEFEKGNICILLSRLERRNFFIKRQVMDRFGITFQQGRILLYLSKYPQGSLNQADLAAHFDVKPSSVNSVLSGMIKNGLAEKRVNGRDARNFDLFATEKGKELAKMMKESFDLIDQKIIEVLTEPERATMLSLLHKLLEAEPSAADIG